MIGAQYLESYEDGVCLADESDGCRTLLDGLQSIFDLEDTTLGGATVREDVSVLRVTDGIDGCETYNVTESLS